MQVKQITKCQFFLTVSESELLIVEGYSKLFNMTIQQSALVMCVNGWNSYAQKMAQYSKNVRIQPQGPDALRLLQNDKRLDSKSNESVAFDSAMSKVMMDIAIKQNVKTKEEF